MLKLQETSLPELKADAIGIVIPCDPFVAAATTKGSLLLVIEPDLNGYVIPLNHPDVVNTFSPEEIERAYSDVQWYVMDGKAFNHYTGLTGIDLSLSLHYTSGTDLYHKFREGLRSLAYKFNRTITQRDSLLTVPLFKLVESTEPFLLQLLKCTGVSSQFEYTTVFNQVFGRIEKSGVAVNRVAFESAFSHKIPTSIVRTEYNGYTATGRPSNSAGNVNFAALSNKRGQREPFISRFGNDGILVSLDYDGYHIRLIADLIGYQLPEGSCHEHFLTLYQEMGYDVDYASSKQLTFRNLYGLVDKKISTIPFFADRGALAEEIYSRLKAGKLTSPIYHRPLKFIGVGDNVLKAFNYFIQLYETERNVSVLNPVLDLLDGKRSNLALYTYDSFLFDIYLPEKHILLDIKQILEAGGFPVHVEAGPNYSNMQRLS